MTEAAIAGFLSLTTGRFIPKPPYQVDERTPRMTERSLIATSFLALPGSAPVEWRIEPGLTPYDQALAFMEQRADAIRQGTSGEMVWLVEHPPVYTAGTSAQEQDLVEPDRFPVFKTGRGGEYTYHGPGQRVAYVMLDLKRRREDVRAFVAALEAWIISALAAFNVKGERREDRVGVWVVRPDRPALPDGSPAEDKIAAIGIRLRRWVSFHGIAINVEPELGHFSGIVPCGVTDHGVTSLVDLGLPVTIDDLDVALKTAFEEIFGPAETTATAVRKTA
ncbi:lipoate-protein ligase B [Aminobacter aminovorans]|jgi:lipoyl(octanoyl) transferase|uniref:Octanoyltransferase n=3 Tax=Aminobacter TaxID=31988 RepID=A0AAC8YNZ7_AMIAI|nr:lipoate-protein ligase B [Aminobacter aminovorans]